METTALTIGGMGCAACSARIEKELLKLNGIKSANVNLVSEKATVVYDPRVLRLDGIKEAIVAAGYRVIETSKSAMDEDKNRKEKEIENLVTRFIVAASFALPLLFIAMAPMLGDMAPRFSIHFPKFLAPMQSPLTYALVQLALTIPIIIAGNGFYITGFRNLLRRSPNMDSLIAIGTASAVVFSLYNLFRIMRGDHMVVESLYFETAGIIIALILLGKTLEAATRRRAGDAIKKLMALAPQTALVIQDGLEKEMPIDEVSPGDIIVVKPGARIPADGIVTEGYGAVDESMLTGESMPVGKKAGDSVYGATININGLFRFRAEKTGGKTALAQIIKLVEDAQNSKAPIARMADIASGYFVPVVCVIALFAGIAWLVGTGDLKFALTIFISVLVIACPCALGLATPAAIMAGAGKGAESGILIKSGAALETAGKIQTIVFDKTGTLTGGKPEVAGMIIGNESSLGEDVFLRLVASAEKGSEHPLGQAIVREAEKRSLAMYDVDDFQNIPGRGIEAKTMETGKGEKGISILAGNRKLMDERGINLDGFGSEAARLSSERKTPVFVAIDGKAAGIIAIADVLKKNSRAAIETLRSMGIEIVMITGDNEKTAAAIAREAGIDRVLAEVLPGDKSAEIRKIQESGGNRKRVTAMVGDGINDAPALAQADIGIAIGSGTDVALDSADIVLMRSDLSDVPIAINLSKRTLRIIKQNLFWAFCYNALGIPIAAGLLYIFGGPLLNPMFAAAAMSLSSVSVLANALRLKKGRAVVRPPIP